MDYAELQRIASVHPKISKAKLNELVLYYLIRRKIYTFTADFQTRKIFKLFYEYHANTKLYIYKPEFAELLKEIEGSEND